MALQESEFWRWKEYNWSDPSIDWQSADIIAAGIDVGSVSSQGVLVADGKLLAYSSLRTGSNSPDSAQKAIDWAIKGLDGFTEDKIQLRASALTFYTMLSIVPVLAMIFGISQGFGMEDFLKDTINQRFEEQKELIDLLMGFVDNYLSRFNGAFITAIGLIILFWSVMKVLGNIESSFNNIWQVKKIKNIPTS